MFWLTLITIVFILQPTCVFSAGLSENLVSKNFENAKQIYKLVQENIKFLLLNFLQDTSNIVIEFNPYVSILDAYEQHRYTIDDLVPLVSLVATKFTKMYIQYRPSRFISGITFKIILKCCFIEHITKANIIFISFH